MEKIEDTIDIQFKIETKSDKYTKILTKSTKIKKTKIKENKQYQNCQDQEMKRYQYFFKQTASTMTITLPALPRDTEKILCQVDSFSWKNNMDNLPLFVTLPLSKGFLKADGTSSTIVGQLIGDAGELVGEEITYCYKEGVPIACDCTSSEAPYVFKIQSYIEGAFTDWVFDSEFTLSLSMIVYFKK